MKIRSRRDPRRSRGHGSATRFPLRLEDLEGRQLLSGGIDLKLDFGPSGSPVAAGWTAAGAELYTKSQGYGWASYSGVPVVATFDRGTADPLTRDGVTGIVGRDSYYWVDLPNGTYDVTAILGDPAAIRDKVAIWSEGSARAYNVTTAAGQTTEVSYRVAVTSNRLHMIFLDGGGVTPTFALDGLEVRSVVPEGSLTANAGVDQKAQEGAAVTFAGQATGGTNPTYTWDFGDGTTAAGTLSPTHAYRDNGTYTATLTVVDGTQTATDSAVVTVANVPPTAAIVGGPYTASAGSPMTAQATASDPSPADTAAGFTYTWNFGDGSPQVSGVGLTAPSHTYANAGTFTIQVQATDKDGGTSPAASTTVAVAPPGPTRDLKLDFGPSGSPVAPGWTAAGAENYSAARGYGWVSYSGVPVVATFDRGTADPLTRDGVAGVSGASTYYWVDLPNGDYDVTATLGDATLTRDEINVWSGGTRAYHLMTMPGQFTQLSFRATVASGRLAISFSDDGGVTPSFALNTLEVRTADSGGGLMANAGPDLGVNEGKTAYFFGQASGGTNLTYAWNFGDGTTATGNLSPTHVYKDNGTYTATLTVDNGTQTVTSSAVVTVLNVAPTASIAAGPLTAIVGLPFAALGAASDPSPADTAAGFTYTWDFGDGSPKVSGANLYSPLHAFAAPGLYRVGLVVADKDGGVSSEAFGQIMVSGTATSSALANVGLTPGWATFGEALPQGVAFGGLQLGDLATQTDVKTTWPDGSIRFAVVTASVPTTGTYLLKAAPPRSGTFNPTIPDASVRLDIGGSIYIAALPKVATSDVWLAGPLVREDRATVIPVTADGTPHPFLDVIFDRRSYNDGTTRLDVTVENVMDKAGAGPVTYSVDIVAGGQTVYHHDTLTQYYTTRWRQVFDLGGLTESQVTLDFNPFYEADALPRFLGMDALARTPDSPTGTYPSYAPMAGAPKFDILQGGDLGWDMTAHGGRPELAPYPDWAVKYLLYQDPTQKQYVLANGNLAGSWDVHLREPTGGTYQGLGDDRMISIDERPNFWFDPGYSQGYPWHKAADGTYVGDPTYLQRGNVGDMPAGDPVMSDRGKWYADNNHQPSLAYIPYLVTGDRYYADEMSYWADYDLLATYQDHFGNERDGSMGILTQGNEVRGAGWALRNMADAAAYLPDSDPLKPYLAQKIQNNLDWLDVHAQTANKPLGVAWIKDRPGPDPATQDGMALWNHEYLAWAIDHANKQGFSGGDLWRDQVAQFQISLFNSPDYDPAYAAPAVLAIGDKTPTGINYYTTLKQVFDATYPTGTTPSPFRGYYGSAARMMVVIGLENGWSDAQQTYASLMPALGSVPTSSYTDFDNHPGWYTLPDNES